MEQDAIIPAASGGASPDPALVGALQRLLAPLARLCLANAVSFAAAEEMLKSAFVQEANALHPDAPSHGAVTRISNATGIRRREVTRLLNSDAPVRPGKPPLATELFGRWTTDPAYRDADGAPLTLKRQGPAPSFDALAQSITRDVHPRSLLDELVRLGLARHDEDTDLITLVRDDFVPRDDARQMLGFLSDNVGDHFDAAVANVVQGGGQHLEQAVFADELSRESVEALRPLVTAQWQALCDVLIPTLTDMIQADAAAGRPQDQRVRIGLYSFVASTADGAVPADTAQITDKTS